MIAERVAAADVTEIEFRAQLLCLSLAAQLGAIDWLCRVYYTFIYSTTFGDVG